MKHRLATSIILVVLFMVAGYITVSAQGSDKPTAVPTASPAPTASVGAIPTVVTPDKSSTNANVDTCYDCHDQLRDKSKSANEWHESVHQAAGVGCADCH